MTEETDTSIEELAARWLATERQASDRGNAGGTEERARAASAAYERAVTSASPEELLIAWHAALNVQYACEIGSASSGGGSRRVRAVACRDISRVVRFRIERDR